jgi:hypothetical protein
VGPVKPILSALAGEFAVSEDDMRAIESYIHQIHRIDALSFAFRYMHKKTGDVSIDTANLPHINIGALAAAMEKLTTFLSGLGHAFDEHIKVERDMRAEADADYREAYSDI